MPSEFFPQGFRACAIINVEMTDMVKLPVQNGWLYVLQFTFSPIAHITPKVLTEKFHDHVTHSMRLSSYPDVDPLDYCQMYTTALTMVKIA